LDAGSGRRRSEAPAAETEWPLLVTVRTPAKQPIAGASVKVQVAPRGADDLPKREVASGETTADGTFRCSLGGLRERSALFRRMNYVWVTATHEGTQPRWTLLALPRTAAPQRFVAELELRLTVAIAGRVIDGDGAPVPAAELYEVSGKYLSKCFERPDAEGRFVLSVQPEDWGAERPDFAASDPALGSGSVALPALGEPPALGDVIEVGTIMLMQRDVIRGHVVLGDGTPLGGFPVHLYPVEAAQASDPVAVKRAFGWQGSPQRELLRGKRDRLVRSRAVRTTGPDGSFAFAGLDPDSRYAVAVRDTALQVIAMPARVGDDGVRLVVERQLLLLDVRSDAGEPLPGARILAEGYPPESKLPPPERIRPGFPATQPQVRARFYPADAEGRCMILSRFGWVWRIGSFDEIALPDFVRHEVFPDMHRAHLEVPLRAETRFGSVRLAVVDERGEPFDPFEVRLRCLDKDADRLTGSSAVRTDPVIADLPAGRWQVTVGAGGELDYDADLYQRGAHVREIEVADGVTTELYLEVPAAGLAGFRLRSASPPPGGVWEDLTIRAVPAGAVIPFHVMDQDNWNRWRPVVGVPCIAKQSLPPGAHTFVIEAKGYQPARCVVQVVADRLVTVDVNLFAR
jgi:hypothetical protein